MKIGYPDNPVSETKKVFLESYLISSYSSIDYIILKGFNLIELHFQTFEEMDNIKEIKDYVKSLKNKGINLIMHMPFMMLNKDGFDLSLPISVKSIKNCKRADINQIKKAIGLCSELGISIITMHASSALKFLDEDEFEEFKRLILTIDEFSRSNKVILSIETGGLKKEQIDDLIDMGLKITLDTAHLVVDMMIQNWNIEESNKIVFDFFIKNSKNIPVVHMSQTIAGKDSHLPIEKEGIVYINNQIMSFIKKNNLETNIIFEFKADKQ